MSRTTLSSIARVIAIVTAAAWTSALAGDDTAAAMREARQAWEALDSTKNPLPDDVKALDAWMRADHARLERFADAFGRTDWNAWSLPADREAFTAGLLQYHWLSRRLRRWDDARRALDARVTRLPGEPESAGSRRQLLPELLMSAGDVPSAIAHCTEWDAKTAGRAKARLDMMLGDLRTAVGDARSAVAAYAAADAAMAAWDRKTDADDAPIKSDYTVTAAQEMFRDEVAIRKLLLGKLTTCLHIGPWIGAPTIDWMHLHGKTVVVLLCRAPDHFLDNELTDLERFAKSQTGKAVQALAVVRPSSLPETSPGKLQRPAERAAAFREAHALSVPIALLDDAEFAKITGGQKSSVVVVADANRTIVHASVGDPDQLAAMGIAQYLADKLVPAPAPAGGTPPK
jgi:hypothetical protein